MKRRAFLRYSLMFVGSCFAACSQSNSSNQSIPKLTLAITDVREEEDLKALYEAFRSVLSETLKTEIEFFPVESYTNPAIALKSGDLDLAFTGPSEYVIISSRTNAIPILSMTRPEYRSVLVVPAGSPIKRTADLKDKTIAMKSVGSTSGHLGPTKLLLDGGLDPKTDVNIVFLGEEGAIEALRNGEVDAWGGSGIVYDQELQDETDAFSMLVEGPPLPNDVFVASSGVELAVIEQIKERMLANKTELVAAISRYETRYTGSELVIAKDEDYDPIREVYTAIGQGDFIF